MTVQRLIHISPYALTLLVSVAALLMLSGCKGLMLGAAGRTGVAAAEERSLGTVVDDNAIYAEIQHNFIQVDTNNLFVDIDVRVNEGRVLLTGQTPRQEIALEAVKQAWLATGVREVINEIKVIQQENKALDFAQDQLIETQIEARLLATKNIRSINYTVEVVDGTVYLLGIAQNAEELRNVAHIASITSGVKEVISYVRLKENPKRQNTNQPSVPPVAE